jgi:hypothetical protein
MACDEIFSIFQIYKIILDYIPGNILQLGRQQFGVLNAADDGVF